MKTIEIKSKVTFRKNNGKLKKNKKTKHVQDWELQ